MAPPTSTVNAPTGGAIGPGSGSSGIGPGSVAAPLPTHGPRAPTAPANRQVGVQQPGATNQNQKPSAVPPEQRTMTQKIQDLTSTLQKPHDDSMSAGQKMSASMGQVANNMRGADGSLQTGLGLNMRPSGGFGQQYKVPDPTGGWWGSGSPATA